MSDRGECGPSEAIGGEQYGCGNSGETGEEGRSSVKDPAKKINMEHICKIQDTIDELERRVRELEKELEEAKKEL